MLWRHKDAEDVFVCQWDVFARPYRDVEQDELSFNLANEAPTARPIQVIAIVGACTHNELLGRVKSLSVVQKSRSRK